MWWVGPGWAARLAPSRLLPPRAASPPAGQGRKREQEQEISCAEIKTGTSLSSFCQVQNRLDRIIYIYCHLRSIFESSPWAAVPLAGFLSWSTSSFSSGLGVPPPLSVRHFLPSCKYTFPMAPPFWLLGPAETCRGPAGACSVQHRAAPASPHRGALQPRCQHLAI